MDGYFRFVFQQEDADEISLVGQNDGLLWSLGDLMDKNLIRLWFNL